MVDLVNNAQHISLINQNFNEDVIYSKVIKNDLYKYRVKKTYFYR